jgi:CRP/FNR family transcriptional regulator
MAPAEGAVSLRHDPHDWCRAVSGMLRGNLCEQLARRPARHVVPGQFLYFAGEPAHSVFYLKSGLVRTGRTSPAGEEVILQLHRPGEIFGETCFCTGRRHEHAVALEPSETVEILTEDLLGQLQRNPEAMRDFVGTLCDRLGELSVRIQSLSFETTAERLARTLLVLADTLGANGPDGTHTVPYVRQDELARMVAARREVVSGILNRLREAGLIDYSRKGRISVHRQALETYLASLGAEQS